MYIVEELSIHTFRTPRSHRIFSELFHSGQHIPQFFIQHNLANPLLGQHVLDPQGSQLYWVKSGWLQIDQIVHKQHN